MRSNKLRVMNVCIVDFVKSEELHNNDSTTCKSLKTEQQNHSYLILFPTGIEPAACSLKQIDTL